MFHANILWKAMLFQQIECRTNKPLASTESQMEAQEN